MPELLVSAPSAESLNAAAACGADAISLDLNIFSSSNKGGNFTYAQIEGALRSLRRKNRRLYVTLNTVFEQREADRVFQLLKYLAGLGPDAVIVHDFGIARMSKEHFPALKLFASPKMNIASARAANFLSRCGFSRAVLPRELSLEEIRDIRANTNMELEFQVHGVSCASVCGLCLFSSCLGGKSANRGMCTQACRRYYQVPDSAQGGYYFNPQDIQLIEKIPALAEAGVNSFKIDGRMKSADQTGTVVSAYRLVIDSLGSGHEEAATKEALDMLRSDSGIGSSYPKVIPKDLSAFKRTPRRDKAPLPMLPKPEKAPRGKSKAAYLPEGFYVQVSRPEDFYSIQSIRPAKAMLNYQHSFLSRLIGAQKQPLPFTPEQTILVLDPFFFQSQDEELSEDIPALIARGYHSFVVNNAGHFSLFKDTGAALIIGPWLYVFNQWAWLLATGNTAGKGVEYFISPLENNRQNLEKTLPQEHRPSAFITVYSRPSLFRIRGEGSSYEFTEFQDSRDENFRLSTSPEGSLVYPEKPFYIGDKVPFLQKAGFSRFILDLSDSVVKKQDYKALFQAVKDEKHIPGTGRFNWKDGFFAEK